MDSYKTLESVKKIKIKKMVPYFFIGPAVIYIFAVTILPIIMALPISFTDWSALTPNKNFVGLENYKNLIQDKDFWRSCLITAKFFVFVPIVMAVSLATALLLNRKIKGVKFFRVIFYSPVITSTVAAALLFQWFYQPSFGLFNSILNSIGLNGIGWVKDISTAVMSVILFKVWKEFGVGMLIYLAGLQDVPAEVKEAASIDGASGWQNFIYITMPLLRPAHIYLLITNVIHVFMVFQETYMLKGPLNSTRSVINYIYDKSFSSAEMGYACSMSFVLFVIVMSITLVQLKATKLETL